MPSAIVIGNSDGIGLALTRSLLADGWEVVGLSRSASPCAANNYQHHVVDVRAADYPTRLQAAIDGLSAPLVCVYCVGVGEFVDLERLEPEQAVFESNLLGAVATTTIVIPAMIRTGAGHFVGLSSQADQVVDQRAPSYAASKAGLSSYLEGLALACRPRGVYVTNLRFGFVDTKMAKAPAKPFLITAAQAAERVRRCLRRRPMRDTYPKRMAALLWMFRVGVRVRQWFAG